ncbi:transposase [Bradyrhizobium sp. WBAH10]|uniref:transposase n=2 Tax=Bradyrhizobium TaxID=374 RepID=UPI003A1003DC
MTCFFGGGLWQMPCMKPCLMPGRKAAPINPLERIMKEIRRRTRVVGAFPDGQSCLNLAAARLRHIAGTAWPTKCYMNMRPLYQPQLSETGAVA